MVTAYKMSGLEAAIARRLIRVPSVILANLVLGENVVPEFMQTDCTPERLRRRCCRCCPTARSGGAQIEAFARFDEHHGNRHGGAGRRAAEIVLTMLLTARHLDRLPVGVKSWHPAA